jgi:hypothetical protein
MQAQHADLLRAHVDPGHPREHAVCLPTRPRPTHSHTRVSSPPTYACVPLAPQQPARMAARWSNLARGAFAATSYTRVVCTVSLAISRGGTRAPRPRHRRAAGSGPSARSGRTRACPAVARSARPGLSDVSDAGCARALHTRLAGHGAGEENALLAPVLLSQFPILSSLLLSLYGARI